ncbi:MAG: OmpH family outer membrane protein [Bacteroidota bacterium]
MTSKLSKPRILFTALMLIIALQIFSFSYQFIDTKEEIVYIDNARLLDNYQGMIDARQDFERKSMAWKANIDTLMNDVQVAIQNYEKESAGLTRKEKRLSQELIKTKQQQLQNYQLAIQKQSAEEDARMTEAVLTKVNSFLTDYGKQNSYKVIMGANASGNIIYAQDGLDITDEVVEALNQHYTGG